jgi:hypothetical protein
MDSKNNNNETKEILSIDGADLQLDKSLVESDDNALIQNKKSYDFTAPLQIQEIDEFNNSNQSRVKFLSDYSKSAAAPTESAPLLSNDQKEENANAGRFRISHISDPNNILETNDQSKYFIDEKGNLIIHSNKGASSNQSSPSKAKSIKYVLFFKCSFFLIIKN